MNCYYNSIQTMGTLDGPGVRFVLFLQGCPLRCAYCHNPDTWNINTGNIASVKEIFSQIKRCQNYFGKKGGVTVSGGEPLLQAGFVIELFSLCKENNIHTALDTSGCIWNENIEKLLSVTDLVMLDVKMTNDSDYKNYIGCEYNKPLFFLKQLQMLNVSTWLRQVIISGINDNDENIKKLADLKKTYSCVSYIELLPFHKLCTEKYTNLGIAFPLEHIPQTSGEQIDKLYELIKFYSDIQ